MKIHELVSDDLWAVIAPSSPPPAAAEGWAARLPDRPALCGILYVLETGIQWHMLPLELGCGSGVTCWRRRRDGHGAGDCQPHPGPLL